MANFYNPYQQMMNGYYPQYQQAQPQAQPQPQQVQHIQNGGFVSVRGEAEALNYPVAPGNSVTFKDETAPYVYTKTMGFSQLDRPIFEKYRLVKEDISSGGSETASKGDEVADPINDTIDALKMDIQSIWDEIEKLKHDYVKKQSKDTKKERKGGDDRHDE